MVKQGQEKPTKTELAIKNSHQLVVKEMVL